MDQSYIDLFDEKDTIEDNKYQTILQGSKKNAPDQSVIINKLKKNSAYGIAFRDLLANSLQHLLHIEENEAEIILVTEDLSGESLNVHLNFSRVSEEDRINYLYEYLHKAVAYIAFDNCLINILIDPQQILFENNKLVLKEHMFINQSLANTTPFVLVAKRIGIAAQKILTTNFNTVKKTHKYRTLLDFSDLLIQCKHDFTSIDDVFSAFKLLYYDDAKGKRGLLLGNMHPNNMFYDKIEELPLTKGEATQTDTHFTESQDDKATVKAYNTEVTSEEREMLTGFSTDDPTMKVFEGEIDLSKLSYETSGLDDLIVDDKNKEDEVLYGFPDALKVPSYMNNDKKRKEPTSLKTLFNPKIFILVVILVFGALGAVFIPKLLSPDTGEPKRPTASFDIEIKDNRLFCRNLSQAYNEEVLVSSYWLLELNGTVLAEETGAEKANFDVSGLSEATYKITLIVTDSLGRNSEPYTLERRFQNSVTKVLENERHMTKIATNKSYAQSGDLLDTFDLDTTTNVVEDYSIKYTGDKSVKVDLRENNGIASLSFNDLVTRKDTVVSFWLMSNLKEPITINIIGYNHNILLFNKTIPYCPTAPLSWNAFSTNLIHEEQTHFADRLEIQLTSKDAVVWFDDISIKTFK